MIPGLTDPASTADYEAMRAAASAEQRRRHAIIDLHAAGDAVARALADLVHGIDYALPQPAMATRLDTARAAIASWREVADATWPQEGQP